MFSQACVIPSVHAGGSYPSMQLGGVCLSRGVSAGGGVCPEARGVMFLLDTSKIYLPWHEQLISLTYITQK